MVGPFGLKFCVAFKNNPGKVLMVLRSILAAILSLGGHFGYLIVNMGGCYISADNSMEVQTCKEIFQQIGCIHGMSYNMT